MHNVIFKRKKKIVFLRLDNINGCHLVRLKYHGHAPTLSAVTGSQTVEVEYVQVGWSM